MACPVCGSEDVVEWYPATVESVEAVPFSYCFTPAHCKTFRVVRCRACTHVYCWPLPPEIGSRYRDVVDEVYLQHGPSRRLSAEAVLDDIAEYVPDGMLLDVGCATGDFLLCARERGYKVAGIELSRWSARLAREQGLDVHEEYVGAFSSRHHQQYDVVTLLGVIEHLASPAAEIRLVRDILKPGGMLVIWTGDVDSVTSRVLGRRWWYWQGQHIQYFTHASLRRLVESCGFQHARTGVYPFGATYDTIANSIRRYRGARLLSVPLRLCFSIKPTWLWRIPGEMLLFARRAS